MTRNRKVLVTKIATVLAVPLLLWAYQGGPPGRRTGAPGDNTCADTNCHAGVVNSGPGEVGIAFSNGMSYVPGTTQRWTVTVTDPNASVYGFQATARLASNAALAQAGSFAPLDETTFVLCDTGGARVGNGPCPVSPVEFIEHTEPSNSGSFTFDWKAPETNVGPVEVYVAGNAANGDRSPGGDRIYTAMFTLTPAAAGPAPAIRDALPVLQAFDNTERASGGTFLQIYGDNLSDTDRQWSGNDFTPNAGPGGQAPTSLDGVEVLVNGKNAFVSYIGNNQVNALVDSDDAVGPVSVQIRNRNGTSNTVNVTMTAASPALHEHPLWVQGETKFVVAYMDEFTKFANKEGLVPGADREMEAPRPGEVVSIFAVGCGPTNPAISPGRIPEVLTRTVSAFEVHIGGVVAQAEGFRVPGLAGLYQFNITVPNLSPGDYPIELTVTGVPTGQGLFFTVRD